MAMGKRDVVPDLSEADLSKPNFRNANFSATQFIRTNFWKSRRRQSHLREQISAGRNLVGRLQQADFTEATSQTPI